MNYIFNLTKSWKRVRGGLQVSLSKRSSGKEIRILIFQSGDQFGDLKSWRCSTFWCTSRRGGQQRWKVCGLMRSECRRLCSQTNYQQTFLEGSVPASHEWCWERCEKQGRWEWKWMSGTLTFGRVNDWGEEPSNKFGRIMWSVWKLKKFMIDINGVQ